MNIVAAVKIKFSFSLYSLLPTIYVKKACLNGLMFTGTAIVILKHIIKTAIIIGISTP